MFLFVVKGINEYIYFVTSSFTFSNFPQTQIFKSLQFDVANRFVKFSIHSLKYMKSTTLGCDSWQSEFVTNIQFLYDPPPSPSAKQITKLLTLLFSYKQTNKDNINKNKEPSTLEQVKYCKYRVELRWNLKNLSRGLNPPKPGLNEAPA